MLILASGSPRRRQLLSNIGLKFDILPVGINEQRNIGESPENFAIRMAKEKAIASFNKHRIKDSLYMAADTIVVFNDIVLGKPKNRNHAKDMITMLSGKKHTVITAVAILKSDEKEEKYTVCKTFSVHTTVQFKKLSNKEIDWYVSTGEPDDKAGAYAAQGIGAMIIKSVEGSYTNVIGLPLAETIDALKECEYPLPFI